MLYASAYPEPTMLERGSFAPKDQLPASGSISKARTVLRFAARMRPVSGSRCAELRYLAGQQITD
jgi:hypothetical protein